MRKWNRAWHTYPCPETDHIDEVLNELEACLITLSPAEIEQCQRIGQKRNHASKGRANNRLSDSDSDELVNVIGTLGEMAAAKYLGIAYQGEINTFRNADLLEQIEVRTATSLRARLKIRPDDDDRRLVVQVITQGIGTPLRLTGWIPAGLGKQIGKKEDPYFKGKWFYGVPQEVLFPMKELFARLKLSKA